eukprot:6833132-Pyramimonas_sp.AAC.1
MIRESICQTPQDSIVAKELHDISIRIWRLMGQDVAIITIYLTASIGFSGENIKKMRHLLQIVRGLGNMPWLARGNFINAPQELADAPWLKLLGSAVVVPHSVSHTCSSGSGRLIDCAI